MSDWVFSSVLVPKLRLHCPQLSVVGAGHARDEEANTKYCNPNIAGMARSYGGIVAVKLWLENQESEALASRDGKLELPGLNSQAGAINLNGDVMNSNSEPLFNQYADMDFTDAKRSGEIPALAQLQTEHGGKSRITMRVDSDTLAFFKARAEITGSSYKTMINEALKQFAQGITLADVVRETIRKELHS